MRVIVATKDTQGASPGDYSWTVAGELVTPVVANCSSPDRCGCGRGFPGLASAKSTTTATVVDLPHITLNDLGDAIFDWLDRGGWLDLIPSDDWHELVEEHVEAIQEVAEWFPVGTIIGRHGDHVFARKAQLAA